jgi:hypothetical protein
VTVIVNLCLLIFAMYARESVKYRRIQIRARMLENRLIAICKDQSDAGGNAMSNDQGAILDDDRDLTRIEGDLQRARAAWSSRVGRKDRIWRYLQVVFDIGQRWKKHGKGIRNQELMLKTAKFTIGERQRGRFRVIVYCSSDPKSDSDFRVRNKWVQWLELAGEEIAEGQTFEDFVKGRGRLSDAPLR